MIQVKEAANNLYQNLYNIGFRIQQQCRFSVDSRKCLIKQQVMEAALDAVQETLDSCEQTPDRTFNNLVHKALGTVAPALYYYYQGGTRYIDLAMYLYKFVPDIEYLYAVADFFNNRFVMNLDCYLVVLENESIDRELLMCKVRSSSSLYIDAYMSMSIILLQKGETIKVKRVPDKEYTCFQYNPSKLISSVVFSVSNNQICGRVDNSKWEDSAWKL